MLSVEQKTREGQNQLNNEEHYRPLTEPMVEDTKLRVHQLINELYQGNHIDEMTKKWLYQTPDPHRIPIFYTLTKIQKPTPVGRPIISGCDGPTEKLSSFVDKILQPIAQQQESIDRYDSLHQFSGKNESSRRHNSCFNGRNESIHKHTTRGGNSHSVQGLRRLL